MRTILICAGGLAAAALVAQQAATFSVLKSDARLGRQAEGLYLVPTNQMLRPWGELTAIQGRPVDMAFDSARRVLAVLNTNSVGFFSWIHRRETRRGTGRGGGHPAAQHVLCRHRVPSGRS